MRLAPRLVLAFGFVSALSVAGLGYVLREDRRQSETQRPPKEFARPAPYSPRGWPHRDFPSGPSFCS